MTLESQIVTLCWFNDCTSGSSFLALQPHAKFHARLISQGPSPLISYRR
jgi:hypothetical protein